MTIAYKVEREFIYGWDDAGWRNPGTAWLFNTHAAAQEEINSLCLYMGYDPAEFRVVAV